MVMKLKLLKTAFLEIKARKKIFISLLFMSFLGVGFFAGIKATSPSMKNTLESYFNDLNIYDIELTSTMFTSKDKDNILEIEGIENVELGISYDDIATYDDNKPVVKIYSILDNINQLNLVDGRMPENYDECVIDEKILTNDPKFSIGDYIEITDNNNLLKSKKVKVVGIVNSPLYISSVRGNTNLASGTIDYFVYIPKDNFAYDNIYTNMYITMDSSKETYSNAYLKEVNSIEDKISQIYNNAYITNRTENTGYISFIQDTERIDNISKIFPVIFFIVAVLISLTSMTRMVEEQRVEIGTLKAMGYSSFDIASKYVIYASVASIIGGIAGIIVGVNLIPRLIYSMYEIMYTTKKLMISYNLSFSFFGLLLSYFCIIGATIYAIVKELKNNPAVLMRPKAPKIGKRVLLERISVIWNRLSFTNKVTVRNIFRYKKRFLMTIIGIAGCTALIFSGFALKESVSSLLPSQYGNIFSYDIEAISLKNLNDTELEKLKENENITDYNKIMTQSLTAQKNDITVDETYLMVFENSDVDNFIKIKNPKNSKKISINDGVIITNKLAELLDVEIGDEIEIINSENKKIKITIDNICENYMYHYIYMSKDIYEKISGEEATFNAVLINTIYDDEESQKKVAEEVLKDNVFSQAIVTKTTANLMNEIMSNLNYVVVVLIVSAGILAFSVLYNLSNVNISERIRELATIKVLGFYDREVHNYVEKESIILTVIGIFIGLIFGYFLSFAIIETCELDIMVIPVDFSINCYVYSVIITVIFTIIISIFSYFNLKKINMIESLKSIE